MAVSFETIKKPVKIGVIAALILVISVLHYRSGHGSLEIHLLHRELYFVPILLASFWFGLSFGLVTSLLISLIYAPHLFMTQDPHGSLVMVGSQVLIFNLVAIMLGLLVDRQKRQQQENLAVENMAVLGRAASAVGHEMGDLLKSLKHLAHKTDGLQCTAVDRDFEQELARLEK